MIPWLWEAPPTDRRYYPLYAACVELGVPFCTQVGHTGPMRPSETGRPIPYIDQVAIDFPELVIVCGHIGYPWTEEMVAVARKHENVYIDTSAYTAKRYPPELVRYMTSRGGRRKVMFGEQLSDDRAERGAGGSRRARARRRDARALPGRQRAPRVRSRPTRPLDERERAEMAKVLVTGMSGTGKSSALLALGRRGHRVVDTDAPGWTEWVASSEELGGGEWLWVEDRMTELLCLDEPRTLFVQGCVRNQAKFYDRFDAVVLLSAPAR